MYIGDKINASDVPPASTLYTGARVMLLRRSGVEKADVVLDASFIKAWSIRHPQDNRRGFSDPDARVGRHGRGYDLGYKFHIALDHQRILPLAGVLAPANDNEKRHGPTRAQEYCLFQ